MLVSEQARVFQVRGLRCSKEPTVLGLSPVRLGNRTYRAWRTPKFYGVYKPHHRCSLQDTKRDLTHSATQRTQFTVQ